MAQGHFQSYCCGVPGIEAVEAESKHVFSRHSHAQFGIGLILRGAQRSHSGRGTVDAGPGDTITVNPGEVHDGAPVGGAARAWRMLYFDPALVADALADISEAKTRNYEFHSPVIGDARLGAAFDALFCAVTTAPGSTLLRQQLILTLLADAIGERTVAVASAHVPRAAVARAQSLIDADPAAPLTLADLARAGGVSQFQMLRGFAKATGFTPHAYLIQRRIDLVRRLIAQGSPLAQAAAAGGFADQSHMTRIFVRKYGISPGAYAQAAR